MDIEKSINLKFNGCAKTAKQVQNEFKKNIKGSLESGNLLKEMSNVITEIYVTEVSYLLQLEILIQYFILPLKSNNLIPSSYLTLVFGNIFQLYKVNVELLDAIELKPNEPCMAFCTFAPFLKLYSIYAFGYKKALNVLEDLQRSSKKLSQFLRGQETRPEVGASLLSLLIAPIQRVPRYRLLLQALLESTNVLHPQYEVTKDALLKAEDTALHINKLITEAENGDAMVDLARRLGKRGEELVIPGRKIIKQGVLMKTTKNGARYQERFVVLFTDSLLWCKGSKKGPLTFSQLIPLHHLHVEPALGCGLFKIISGEENVLFFTDDAEYGKNWLNEIIEASQQHADRQKTLRKESSRRTLKVRNILSTARLKTAAIVRRTRGAGNMCSLIKIKRLKRKRKVNRT